MKYYSTNKKSANVSFKDAILKGLAQDRGLFVPEVIPSFEKSFFEELQNLSFQEISFSIANKFIGDEITNSSLADIIQSSISFEAPLIELSEKLNILELFHGPTLAFKDFGARFMARTMEYFLRNESEEITILVATSGDTGSAVANGFLNVDGIKVIVLFPKNKISKFQEKQITTLGNNITAIEIDGTFDDCQKIVKTAFVDEFLNTKLKLSSANSINIGRLIPQSFYYFESFKQLKNNSNVVYSVPSGNLGNLTAGLIAKKMGLPINRFIAATNANNVFTEYIDCGKFIPRPSVLTLSNAMDVGDPSNFARINEIFSEDHLLIKEIIFSKSFNDDETIEKIYSIYEKYNYLIDPHGAIGCLAFNNYLNEIDDNATGVVLETAHPAKFIDVFKNNDKIIPQIPSRLTSALQKESMIVSLPNNYKIFRDFLIE